MAGLKSNLIEIDNLKNLKHIISLLLVFATITAYSQHTYTLYLNVDSTYQTIDNFGASGAWFAENIGKYWPQEKKEKIAELLFSKKTDEEGNPKGIGLSAWRFNIGAGTQEQGKESGIRDVRKRVESFQNPDGSYDWSKQEGYLWFVKKAKQYGVENLIAFSNSPPVQFTKNGLGFKTEKDKTSNLKSDKYDDFASFLATVVDHFKNEGIEFNYLSPINEPQWDWYGEVGKAKQEGSYWTNEEINKLIKKLDASLTQKNLDTKILLPEAAQLDFLYEGSDKSQDQIDDFFSSESPLYVANLKHVPSLVAGHSYFTDSPDKRLITIRRKVKEAAKEKGIEFWQSEYSMLGNGYREGKKQATAMDCALFLSKVIHFDLTQANASAWQFWNALEPGRTDFNTRYYLIALQPNKEHTNGTFSPVKNLWALGHYSYFIKPGMKRIKISTGLNPLKSAQNLMASAYVNPDSRRMVMVLINYSEETVQVKLKEQLKDFKNYRQFITSEEEGMNLKKIKDAGVPETLSISKRSISTFVFDKK